MKFVLKEAIGHWGYIYDYTNVPTNECQYNKLLQVVDDLMKISREKPDDHVTSLLTLIAKNIEEYESQRFLTKQASPVEILEFLMDEHGISQSDLPEIGSQSLVSKILNGSRQLTVEHIQKLSKRFGVSTSLFIN